MGMDAHALGDVEDEASIPSSYTLLPSHPDTPQRRPLSGIVGIIASVMFLTSLVGLIYKQGPESPVMHPPHSPQKLDPPSRGVSEGVSEKSFRPFLGDCPYNWTEAMLAWQRTAYHFQPEKNWMNDPDGPLFHMGWYHLFYQYNPDSAIWGNITWGHAVSTDLIHWLYLPLAMVPDSWFDINGVWTGSATILPDGQIVILYTGDTDTVDAVQVQNLAYPANLSDPLLLDWVKYPGNPVIVPPPGINSSEFRDPTTAWFGPDGTWRITIGSKVNTTGISLVYQTTNFTSYELLDGVLHGVPGTGMWECVDFYPVAIDGSTGLDTSVNGPGVKHVLKASLDDKKHDYYAVGTYDAVNDRWTPDNPEEDVGIGLRVDYGRFYASKSFYDQNKKRRILWGWIAETDSEDDDIEKGWASVQTIPRTIVFDNKTGTNILQWPVEEIESLRLNKTEFQGIELAPGSIVPLDINGTATQLDITAEFEMDTETILNLDATDVSYNCSGAAAERGTLGPFGLLVLANDALDELTPIYFYIAKATDGTLKNFFCADKTRSSMATSVERRVYGSEVPVLDGENFSMRVLVDHSIVESFAQGGRTVITSRMYPTQAIYGAARLFLFNNATQVNVTATVNVWQLNSAFIHPYPLDQI